MQKKTIILIALGFIGLWVASQLFKTSVVVQDNHIVIDKAGHHIEGTLGPEQSYEFLIKNAEMAVNTFSGDGLVTLMPFGEAEVLRSQYGDFFQSDVPDAVEAIQRMPLAILFAQDPGVKAQVKEALGLLKNQQVPVIAFNGALIQVTRHTYLALEAGKANAAQFYYLKDFKLLRPNYP